MLVLGAAGGVGSAAMQIGKAARRPRRRRGVERREGRVLPALGADATIIITAGNMREALKALTAATPGRRLRPRRRRSRRAGPSARSPGAAAISWSVSRRAAFRRCRFNLALLKGASIVGVFWGDFARREPKAFAATCRAASWYGEGKIKPAIDAAAADARAARGLRAHGHPPGPRQAGDVQSLRAASSVSAAQRIERARRGRGLPGELSPEIARDGQKDELAHDRNSGVRNGNGARGRTRQPACRGPSAAAQQGRRRRVLRPDVQPVPPGRGDPTSTPAPSYIQHNPHVPTARRLHRVLREDGEGLSEQAGRFSG